MPYALGGKQSDISPGLHGRGGLSSLRSLCLYTAWNGHSESKNIENIDKSVHTERKMASTWIVSI